MRDSLFETLLGFFWVVLFLYLEFFGLFHAFKSHGKDDGILAVIIPPIAWYRAIEYWWHDDFRGLDWGKRIDEDATLIAYLMNASYATDPDTKRKSIEAIEFVRNRFESYPEERQRELQELSHAYCEFMIAMGSELQTHFSENAYAEYLPQFNPSFSLGTKMSKFAAYPELNDLLKTNLDALQLMFKGDFQDRSDDETETVLETIDLALKRSATTMAMTFESIFGRRPRFTPSELPVEPQGST